MRERDLHERPPPRRRPLRRALRALPILVRGLLRRTTDAVRAARPPWPIATEPEETVER
jgi:hypothetical protein